MATVDTRISGDVSITIVASSTGRLLTAADLAMLPDELPSGPVDFELHAGKLAIMSPTGESHANAQTCIASAFYVQGKQRGLGRAYTEVGFIVSRNPDTVVGPDVAFIGIDRLPVRESPEGYIETPPHIVVEVRSKNDSRAELVRKAELYLSAGVDEVWVVDGTDLSITICRAGTAAESFGESGMVPPPAVLPDFKLTVREVFA